MAQRFLVHFDHRQHVVELETGEGHPRLRLADGEWAEAVLQKVGESDLYMLLIDGRPQELYVQRSGRTFTVTIGRNEFSAEVGPWRAGQESGPGRGVAAGGALMKSPMTGTVVEVLVQPGAEVKQGDVILLVESMKMNNELAAPASGTVQEVYVAPGERVEKGAKLVLIE